MVSAMRRTAPSALLSTAIGLTAALAMLTRMDSFVVVAPLIAVYASHVGATYGGRKLAAFAPAVAVPLAICGVWLTWKLAYYGALLPNSYHAKVEGIAQARHGASFVLSFVQAYAFYLPVACVPVGLWLAWERRLDRRVVAILAVPLVCWLAYVIRVGGDFMEYRFLIPVLPLAFLGTYWVMCELDVPARTRRRAHVPGLGRRDVGVSFAASPEARRLAAAYGRTRRDPEPGMVPDRRGSR